MELFARKVNNYNLFGTHAWYVPGIGGMFGMLGWFVVGSLLGGLVMLILMAFVPQQAVMDYGMIIMYPLQFLPAMIYVAHKSQHNSLFEPGYKLNNNNFGPYKGWVLALITVALTFAFMVASDLPNYANYKLTTASPRMKAFYDTFLETMKQMTGGPFWSSFLVTAIFAPIFEEWMCRGVILRGLLTKMKPGWAIVVSALFFAIIHMNPWQALNAFLIGVIMGYVYYKTGSLLLTMLIHFVNNGTAVIVSQFADVDETEYWIETMPMGTYIPLIIAGTAVLAACIWAFHRIPLQQKRGNIDEIPVTEEVA